MDTIGKYLKEAREAKNLSIEDVSEMTRIKVAFLECIEKDDFSPIGGFGYAKVMLATYAKTIDANVQKVMSLFEHYYDSDDFEMKPLHRKPRQQKKLLLPGNIFSILALVILVTVLTIVVVRLYNKGMLDFSMDHQIEEVTSDDSEKPSEPEAKPEPEPEVVQEKVQEASETIADVKPEPAAEHQINVNQNALRDTTDYVDRILFDGKQSAFNHKE